jgi:hypothetical protein
MTQESVVSGPFAYRYGLVKVTMPKNLVVNQFYSVLLSVMHIYENPLFIRLGTMIK